VDKQRDEKVSWVPPNTEEKKLQLLKFVLAISASLSITFKGL